MSVTIIMINKRLGYFILTLVLAAFLGACSETKKTSSGGGSNTSTEGQTGDPTADAAGDQGSTGDGASLYAGTYKGTVTVTVKALLLEYSENSDVTIVVDSNGNYTVSTDSGFSGSGALDGNSFSFSRDGNISDSGINCSGTVGVKGTISGNSINGTTFTNNLMCNPDIGASISGTLNATKV